MPPLPHQSEVSISREDSLWWTLGSSIGLIALTIFTLDFSRDRMASDDLLNFFRINFGNEISSQISDNLVSGEKDIFSEIYENLMNHQERKEYGQFFTHKELVDYIISNLPISPNSTILDPACGAGAFLSSARKEFGSEVDLYGVDIDGKALEMCELNLQYSCTGKKYNLYNLDTINQVTINTFTSLSQENGFDFIIGNPPFLNLKKRVNYDEKDPCYEGVISGVANSSTLFIAKSLELLKNGGWLGFVLPKNLLRVDSFKEIRKHILDNCVIHHVFDIGHYFKDVRCDQIILILQKIKLSKEGAKEHKVSVSILDSSQEFCKPNKYEIPQSFFRNQKQFPIYIDPAVYGFKNKLSNYPDTLNSFSRDIFRGFSLGSNHPNVSKKRTAESYQILRGKSIKRFTKDINLHLKLDGKNLVKPEEILRQKHPRVVLQNIISKEGGLAACLSEPDCFNLDTVTNVVLEDKSYNKYVMGLLNSRISNFFILVITFLHSNFTMHADKLYIGQIPLVIPNPEQKQKIESIVDKLSNLERQSDQFWIQYDELNKEFYSIYDLSDEEGYLVEGTLSKIMSVKSNG